MTDAPGELETPEGLMVDEAWSLESRWSRDRMAAQFDSDRLDAERAAIIERGRHPT